MSTPSLPSSSLNVIFLMAAVSTACGQSFVTNGLVHYYPLNGNANDAVGTNHGTVIGAVLTTDRFGIANSAYSFDGSSYIQCPDIGFPNGGSERTVTLWLKIASFGNPGPTITYPFSYGVDGPTNAFYLIVDDIDTGAPFIAVGKSGGGDVPRWNGPGTNNWYQVAVTYSNSTASLYVNGSNLVQAVRNYATTLSGEFYIGRYVASPGPPGFYGSISNLRIYNRALPRDEVEQLYQYEGLPQVTSAALTLRLICTNLVVGAPYQIQNSGDLINWINYGPPFIAPSNASLQYVDVGTTNGFFRLLPQ